MEPAGTPATTAAPSTNQAPSAAPAETPGGQAQGSKGQSQAQPQKGDAPKSQPAAPAKVWEIKVNGKVQKVTEAELLSMASMGGAANERFNEASKLRKEAEAALGRIRDPKKMMQALTDPALGLSKDQIRESFESWYAKEFIEPEQMSPEQKRLRDAEDRIKRYEDAERERDEANQKAQDDAMTTQARDELQKQIVDVLENSGLPKTKFTIRRIAHWMRQNHANGFNAPTEVLVNQVRSEFNDTLREMVEASDGEVLIKLLGDGVIKKLRSYDLEQLKKMRGQGQTPTQTGVSESPGRRPQERAPTTAEVNARIREMQRSGKY